LDFQALNDSRISIYCAAAIAENRLITGGKDGFVRLYSFDEG
jgi:hypothetical protein